MRTQEMVCVGSNPTPGPKKHAGVAQWVEQPNQA
jgi:hypothetical protein